MPASSSAVITSSYLDEDILGKLLTGQSLAIRIPAFCDIDVSQKLATWFLNSGSVERYEHEVVRSSNERAYEYYGVDRVGYPFNLTLSGDESAVRKYSTEALPNIRRVRSICAPYVSPIDKLRLELDEVWPEGCQVANFIGRKMFVGIARLMNAEMSVSSEMIPHFDGIPPAVKRFEKQFGANMYLSVPSQGGELMVWDVPGRKDLSPADLPEPTAIIKPAVGDLIIFCAQNMHAIRRFDHGTRISIHAFMGFNSDEPLQLWD